MRTWVLKIEGHYDILLYGDACPTVDDVREILRRRSIDYADYSVTVVVEKSFDFGQGRLPRRPWQYHEEDRHERAKIRQLWREAEEERRREQDQKNRYKVRKLQDRADEVRVDASNQGGGHGGAQDDTTSTGRVGDFDRSPGDELLANVIKATRE